MNVRLRSYASHRSVDYGMSSIMDVATYTVVRLSTKVRGGWAGFEVASGKSLALMFARDLTPLSPDAPEVLAAEQASTEREARIGDGR